MTSKYTGIPEGYNYTVIYHGITVRFATKEIREWWLKLHPEAIKVGIG